MRGIDTWQSRTKYPTIAGENHNLGWLFLALSISIVLMFLVLSIEPAIALFREKLGVVDVKLPTLSQTTRGVMLFDISDHYLCTLHDEQDREPVPLDRVSINVRNAVLAAEDKHFYTHCGIDPNGIARALISNYKAGHVVQGGSTITQQLVRNLYLDKNDKSLKRKIKEACLAWDIDHSYSKAKILETYLNAVYFGSGVYGIERASQHYFNKHACNLTIPQSAFLAGLIRSPSVLGAPQNLKLAIAREHTIIKQMAACGFIPWTVAQKQMSEALVFEPGPQMVPYPYYTGCVMQELKRQLKDELWTHGWKVYTNLDVPTQKLAETKLNNGIASAPHGIDEGALVTMSLKDGAVLALVGGVGDYGNDPWNRALFPHTAGSSFKPFVYLAALIDGIIEPDTMIDDAPLIVDTDKFSSKYAPKNFDGKFMGWINARTALALSRNVCSTRVALKVGLNRVIEMAHVAGIRTQIDPYPSIALGSCAVSPLEMTTAYATLARGGIFMEPQLVRSIHSDDGKTNIDFQATPSRNLPAEPVAQLVDVMQDVVLCGTGTLARLPGIAVAGKTGTADSGKDIWFVGFTPDVVTGVWAGNDKNLPVSGKKVTGGAIMARIWHDYMMSFYRLHKSPTGIAFAPPANRLMANTPQDCDTIPDPAGDAQGAETVTASDGSQLATGGIVRVSEFLQALASRRQHEAMLAESIIPKDNGSSSSGSAAARPDTRVPSIYDCNDRGVPVQDPSVRDMLDADSNSSEGDGQVQRQQK